MDRQKAEIAFIAFDFLSSSPHLTASTAQATAALEKASCDKQRTNPGRRHKWAFGGKKIQRPAGRLRLIIERKR
jgi:hypothetical protein